MNVPCKDCPDRNAGCHSKCERYAEFDKENKLRREERAVLVAIRNTSPNKSARIRKYEIERMRK